MFKVGGWSLARHHGQGRLPKLILTPQEAYEQANHFHQQLCSFL
jgi:hypothetical protein